jgi:hypothetical protein
MFSTPRPSKIYQDWDFWYENIPSGNPGTVVRECEVINKTCDDQSYIHLEITRDIAMLFRKIDLICNVCIFCIEK